MFLLLSDSVSRISILYSGNYKLGLFTYHVSLVSDSEFQSITVAIIKSGLRGVRPTHFTKPTNNEGRVFTFILLRLRKRDL